MYSPQYKYLFAFLILTIISNSSYSQNSNGSIDSPGDIAFVAYHADNGGADQEDGFSFILLDDAPAGTAIRFVDEEWNGTAFIDPANEGEVLWTNSTGSTITVGTVITITDADGSGTAANIGTATEDENGFNLGTSEDFFAIIGSRASPTVFLTAHDGNDGATLVSTGTSLTSSQILSTTQQGRYTGSTTCNSSIGDCLTQVYNTTNWTFGEYTHSGTVVSNFSGAAFSSGGVSGTVSITEASINPGSSFTITVTDADLNTNTAAAETVNVEVDNTTTGENETLTLTETGINTGVFTSSMATAFGTSAGTNDTGSLNVQAGDGVTVTYTDADPSATPTDNVTITGGNTGTIDITESSINPGSSFTITVTDADLNTNTGAAETVDIEVNNTTTGENETVTLTETGINTGIFTASLGTTFGTSSGTNDTGNLNVQGGDGVTATYSDAFTAAGGTASPTDNVSILFIPIFSTSNTQNVAENTTSVVTLTATGSGGAITYSKIGGADESLFSLATDALSFNVAPDFENPGDANNDNAYEVQVRATDSNGSSDLTITVTVTNENDNSPVFTTTAAQSIAENATSIVTLAATDGDAGTSITYSKVGGDDEALFTLTGADLSFTNAPDFENPSDANTDNEYIVQVQASDGTNTTPLTIMVTVTDENDNSPIFSTSVTQSTAENTSSIVTLSATDADAGASVSYSIVGGADQALFDLSSGALSFSAAPDFEAPGDNDTNNEYIVQVRATDGLNNTDLTITVSVTDQNDNTPVFTTATTQGIAENSTSVATIVATDGDAGSSITFSKVGGDDEALFTLTGADLSFTNAPDFENPSDANVDNDYVVQLRANDGVNSTDLTLTITVTDENDNSPVFSTSNTQNIVENTTAVVTLAATDADAGASVSYSIVGGADQALFSLASDALSFSSAPDFESPADVDTNNEYEVQVRASDGSNLTDLTITVTVTDIDDTAPIISSTTPSDNATDVSIATDITVSFDENIQFGTGEIQIIDVTDASNSIVINVSSPGTEATINGSVLTLNPSNNLDLNSDYAINIAATAIEDLAGNSFTGISDLTTFNFTTIATTVGFSSTSSNGDEGVIAVNIEVSLNAISGVNVSVDYSVTGTATGSGTDYTLANGNLIISAGDLTGNITVADIIDDSLDENDETIIVTLTNPTNAGLTSNTIHTYTINDNDPTPSVQFDIEIDSQNESEPSQDLPISISTVSSKTITVDYTISGTATGSGTDYSFANGTFTFDPGDQNRTFGLTGIIDDALDENDETIIITLSNPTNATLGSQQTLVYTIIDNDDAPSVEFSAVSSSAAESVSSADLQVDLASLSGRDVTVDYVVSGTATGNGSDYILADGTLSLSAGENSSTITISSIVANALDENDETVIVTLSNPVNATLGANTVHTYTILDDDDEPGISFSTASSSGPESQNSANVNIDLSSESGRTVSADYVVSGTASNGTDYTLSNGTLIFSAGDVQEIVTISGILDDEILESNETVVISLSNLSNASPGANQVFTYTISNNDDAAVTIEDVSQSENGGAMTFTATLDNQVQGGFSVDVSSIDGTAQIADSDYTSINNTLTFAGNAGESHTFTLSPIADNKVEGDETVTLSLSNLANSTLPIDISDVAEAIFTNDDSAALEIADVTTGEGDGDINVSISLDNAVQGGFTVDVNTINGSATSTNDFVALVSETVSFSGTAGEVQTVTITPIDDALGEPTESLSVEMKNLITPLSASIQITDNATITILDDDAAIVNSLTGPVDRGYGIGNTLNFEVDFNLAVTASGDVTLPITIGSTVYEATLTGTTENTSSLTFTYTIVEGDLDIDGVAVGNALSIGSGASIIDENGVEAIVALNNVADLSDVFVDGIRPTAILSSSAPDLVNGVFTAVVTFDEEVLGLEISDFTITNGSADNLQIISSGEEWSIDVTPSTDGQVDVDLASEVVTDTVGNTSIAAESISKVFDGTAPVISSIIRKDADQLNNSDTDADFTVIFSEDVTGVDATDFTIISTGTATGTVNTVRAVDAKTYTVNVNGISGQGTVGLNAIVNNSILDAALNPMAEARKGETYTINWIPTAINLTSQEIAENNSVGAEIGQLETTDQDSDDIHTYSLVNGAGDSDNGSFNIVGSSLQASENFDFEAKSNYNIRLRSDDGNGGIIEGSFSVTITNKLEPSIIVTGDGEFGEVVLGYSSTNTWTIANNGETVVEVRLASSTSGFTITPLSLVLDIGESQDVQASFSPSEAGEFSGVLNIDYVGVDELGDRVSGIESEIVSGVGVIVTEIATPIKEKMINLYPNPASDKVNIDLSQLNGQEVDLLIMDSSGKLMKLINSVQDKSVTIDMADFRNGVYLVRIQNKVSSVNKKVIIKR